jgi:membrane-bound lytic murein transglycosylase B
MSSVNGARILARRAILSALAGGGLTAVGLGGPLSGGALAADPPTGLEPPSGTSTTPAPQAPTQTTTTSTSTTSTGAGTTTTPAPAGAPTDTSTSTQTTTQAQTTTPATTPTSASEATKPHARGPKVVVRRTQQPTEAPAGATPTGAVTTPTSTPAPALPKSSGNIAAAPQLATAQSSALAAMIAGSAASTRALDFYRIPLFLLPIYQAAAVQYGVPWPILAAINEVETNFGADLSVSTAGAVGWMQFMPETWLQYGVDASGAGYADPYNPVDAVFAAARYLHAAGASSNLRAAILAYNHSEAYVESVLLRARLFASYPPSVIATLTGLTEGSLPVAGAQLSPLSIIPHGVTAPTPLAPSPSAASSATTGGGVASSGGPSSSAHAASALPGSTPAPSPAASAARAERALNAPAPASQLSELLARKRAPVVAVEDGRVVGIGVSRKLGDYVVLRDTYGDLFTYAGLGSIAPGYHLPKPAQVRVPKGALQSAEAGSDPAPKQPATAGRQLPLTLHVAEKKASARAKPKLAGAAALASGGEAAPAGIGKVRVFAHPGNPDALAAARARAKAARARATASGWKKLGRGSVVAQGTVLGHLGSDGESPQASLRFAIKPAGAQSAVDPRPILANWKQLDVALHPQGAKDGPVLAGATASDAFLLSQPELERAVLADPGIKLGACDRAQVASGKVSRRVLALLVFLSRSGLKPTVGELRCGRQLYTPKGLVTAFPPAGTVDIAAINGIPVTSHQGAGTITDVTIRTLLTLQHQLAPKRIVSLMKYPGAPSTVAKADHSSYIQIELPKRVKAAVVSRSATIKPTGSAAGVSSTAQAPVNPILDTLEWQRLMTQVDGLQMPKLARKPSGSAIRDK